MKKVLFYIVVIGIFCSCDNTFSGYEQEGVDDSAAITGNESRVVVLNKIYATVTNVRSNYSILDVQGEVEVECRCEFADPLLYDEIRRLSVVLEDETTGMTYNIGIWLATNMPYDWRKTVRQKFPITRPGKYKVYMDVLGDGPLPILAVPSYFTLLYPSSSYIASRFSPYIRFEWQEASYTACEHGGYIYMHDGKTLSMGPVFVSEPLSENSTQLTQYIECQESNTKTNPGWPGMKYAVALYHTHPPLTMFPNYSRWPGPSSIDLKNMPDMPCFVYDYDVPALYGGHDINLPTKLYSYGLSSRKF